ncbi:hypothetical protein UAY_02071 [Enterococcus moraviensis ATCC BAA-383]|uniref:MucBP domain-containing protein n=1 Tax=Enterococcus moraviensis ATCC BAA-383 TaxID=1158609 RepID=R2QTY6_9ENTE|nr:MucBP domain-containing protein [Enterococcus moraviensis]EOH98803.1 hypothetical protein UAY_02071 [Enterococcus moraviensis ATCC BAA-383]EOT72022.1 hypothetical protein I586_01830 [Enterococcus moraviensis ATCC BAA-383]OJG68142.1 hypothetical protein RV09_GL002253 [Enterococcus moraviensis]
MKKILCYAGFLFLVFLMIYSSEAFAQGNVSSSGITTSDDGTDYVTVGSKFHNIFSEPTEIELNQNKVVYFRQELTVNNGTMTKYLAKFFNQDNIGNSWFQFTSYPTVTKGSAQITYTTDGINFTETPPELNDLIGYKMELTQNIVHADNENNREADLLISFTMAPRADFIIQNNGLDKEIVPFSGGYDSGGYGTYYDWRFRRGVKFTNSPVLGEDVEVSYEDDNGLEIHDPLLIKGNIGDSYDATTEEYQLTIPGYTLNQEKIPLNTVGTITDTKQFVNYVYSKNPVQASDITVKYQDDNGNKLADDVVKTGMIGEAYATEQKEMDGYIFKEVLGNATGFFTDQPQTVTYVYSKVQMANVTAKYQDDLGNKLADDVIKTGTIGERYHTEQKEIEGYSFKEVQGDSTGLFTSTSQTVTYVYTKMPIKMSNVIVHYEDSAGNKLSEDVTKLGLFGEKFTTELKTIVGYTFKKVHGDMTGTFTDATQVVTYIYEKNHTNIPAKSEPSEGSKQSAELLPRTGETKSYLQSVVLLGYVLISIVVAIWLLAHMEQQKRK